MRISIITPTQNRLAYLQECVQSVKASQTVGTEVEIEHIVIASGSTDGTADWFISETAPRQVLFLAEHDPLTPGRARNLAISGCGGQWIMILDDDDVLLQRTVHHFAQAITQYPERRWFVSDFLRVDEELRYMPGEDYYGWHFGSAQEMLQAIFRSEHFVQGNVCFQRSLFDEVGGYDEHRQTAEDLKLYVRFLLAGAQPEALPIVSHLHRMHPANTSRDIDKNHHFNDLSQIYASLKPELDAAGIQLELPD